MPSSSRAKFKPLLPRLEAKSVQEGDCIVWTGARNGDGYGRCSYQGRPDTFVHRAAWIERHGPIPPETPLVLHHCDNRLCWRDEHLYLGTDADNTRDKVQRRRHQRHAQTHCAYGHEFTDDNTYVTRQGARCCRRCRRRNQRAFRQRKKAIRDVDE